MSEHRHQRDDAGSAGDEEERAAARRVPYEVAADGSAHLESVADHGDVIEKGRDLALANALNGDVDHPGALRLRRDRVAALG